MKPLFEEKPKNLKRQKVLNIIGLTALALVATAFVVFVAVLLPVLSSIELIRFH